MSLRDCSDYINQLEVMKQQQAIAIQTIHQVANCWIIRYIIILPTCRILAGFSIYYFTYMQDSCRILGLMQNFYNWIDRVFDECGLPCNSRVKNSHRTGCINGYFQHLNDKEANLFFQTLAMKWERWQSKSIETGLSAGAFVRTSPSAS